MTYIQNISQSLEQIKKYQRLSQISLIQLLASVNHGTGGFLMLSDGIVVNASYN